MAGRLRKGLEYIGSGWIDSKVKSISKRKAKSKPTMVRLVIGVATVLLGLVWISFILCVVFNEDSIAGDVLELLKILTPGVLSAMFSAIGVQMESG